MDKKMKETILGLDSDTFDEDPMFNKIANGSSRNVYMINGTKCVVKVSYTDAGWKQNQNEARIYKKEKRLDRGKFLCPVIGISDTADILIMRYASPINDTEVIPLRDMDLIDLANENNLASGDIDNRNHWGWYRNRMVIVDYGLDTDLLEDEYDDY